MLIQILIISIIISGMLAIMFHIDSEIDCTDANKFNQSLLKEVGEEKAKQYCLQNKSSLWMMIYTIAGLGIVSIILRISMELSNKKNTSNPKNPHGTLPKGFGKKSDEELR